MIVDNKHKYSMLRRISVRLNKTYNPETRIQYPVSSIMNIYTYDNTFDGFLTCVFECYNRKDFPVDICSGVGEQKHLFAERIEIETDQKKADRVWKGVQNKLSGRNSQLPYHAFLSEQEGVEMKIYRFLRKLFSSHFNIETDYGDSDVLYLIQLSQKVKKEAMRMFQFVRFQRTKENIYFCGIEPRYDVIPMIVNHKGLVWN